MGAAFGLRTWGPAWGFCSRLRFRSRREPRRVRSASRTVFLGRDGETERILVVDEDPDVPALCWLRPRQSGLFACRDGRSGGGAAPARGRSAQPGVVGPGGARESTAST